MRKGSVDLETINMVGSIAILLGTVLFFIGIVWYLFNQGTWDRMWTNFNKDKFTSKDMVYQTGSVRVYKFVNGNATCFLADKQNQSVAIYCK